MKRSYTVLFFLLAFLFSQGQTLTVSVTIATANIGDTVFIPVKLTGASNSGIPISSANIQITYDTAVLTYHSLTNFYTATPQNQWFFSGYNGLVSANWLEPSIDTLAIPDSTTLYEIKFIKKAGSTPLTFVVYEFTDVIYNLIPTTPIHGAVNAPVIYHQAIFRVNMQNQVVSPNGVHLAGSFNNWSCSETLMSPETGSIYSATVILPENQSYTYRFVNGDTLTAMETVPAECGVLNSSGEYERIMALASNDTTLNQVCFGMCVDCPLNVSVTFRVNMQNQVVSPNGVHLAGSFNNWSCSETLMSQETGSIYSATVILPENQSYTYRFVNGDTLTAMETVPAECGVLNISGEYERIMALASNDTTLNQVCFGMCIDCPLNVSVTFRVNMQNQVVSSNGVHLAGSFNNWSCSETLMSPETGNIYSATVILPENQSYTYRFVNGDTLTAMETVPVECGVLNSSGEYERIMTLVSNDTTLNQVCFGMCADCPLNVSVTFRVNMQNQVVSPNGVHLAGSFNNWSCSETLMSPETGSIYSATVVLPENQSYTYRFVNGDTLTAMETVPVECGVLNSSGEYERIMTLASNDTTMNQVCFGMCADCPLNVSVTFRVNMQNQVVSPNGVHLAGSFNNWSYSQTSMNQVGGFIYETSVILEEGSSLEFLFVNGNSIAGAEIVPDVCAVNGKRYMTVPNHDSVLIAYCFDSCSACTNVVQYTNVTFKVDMRLVDTISPNGVFIAGSFQGWLPGMTAMITSGDSIYSFSDSLRAGQTVQYKFVNGNTGDEYEIVPLPCAVNGNREITIPVNDTILPLVCFSSCDSCLITGSPDHGSLIKSRLMQNSPNPCNDYTTISFRLHDSGKVNINLFDLTGRKTAVLSEGHYNAGTYKVQVETKQIKSGIYYYQLNFEGTSVFSESKKMVVVH